MICARCRKEIAGNDGTCILAESLAFVGDETPQLLPAIAHDGPQPCGGCGVEPGFLHHWSCGRERCPRCGGQLILCGCQTTYDQAAKG